MSDAIKAFRPHLETEELCSRWHITKYTLSRKHRQLGLRPLRFGRRNLYPIEQVEDAERRQLERD